MIATADHGEMGTSHGGMRQKNFNFYEESMRVPLVYSNPRLFRRPQTNRLRSSPTSTSCRRSRAWSARPARARATGRGSTTPTRSSSRSPSPAQDYTVFTYDDCQSGQADAAPTRKPPNHIVSIREQRYKLARYYDVDGNVPDQWEMYDLHRPARGHNLAYPNQAHPRAGARVQAAAAKLGARREDAAAAASPLSPAVGRVSANDSIEGGERSRGAGRNVQSCTQLGPSGEGCPSGV